MSVKLLPKNFTGTGEAKGFVFKQIENSEKAYIYEVQNGKSLYYEVFKRKTCNRIKFENDKRVILDGEFSEVYPKSNSFGSTAWTYGGLEAARIKFNSI